MGNDEPPTTPGSAALGGGCAEDFVNGLDFEQLAYSPSGKLLAAIAAPEATPQEKVVVVYELSEQRSTLVPLRAVGTSEEGGVPFGMAWQPDDTLVVLRKTNAGLAAGTESALHDDSAHLPVWLHLLVWPPGGAGRTSTPGSAAQTAHQP